MSKKPAPSDLADKFMLRMPDGMRVRVALAAARNNRSMNQEIINRLEETFQQDTNKSVTDVGDYHSRIEKMEAALAEYRTRQLEFDREYGFLTTKDITDVKDEILEAIKESKK